MDQSVPRFTVGITGHRWNKIPKSEGARIAQQLSTLFTAIDLAMKELQANAGSAQALTLRLVSGLAEGADQLAIWSRPSGWMLDAILPFSRAKYLEDFAPANATGEGDQRPAFEAALAQARSIVELPDGDDAVRGYERAGEMLLEEANLLVAVWDGEPAAGRGGTEAVIMRAVALGIPVVWISSKQDCPPMLLLACPETGHSPDAVIASAETIRQVIEPIIKTRVAASHSHSVQTR